MKLFSIILLTTFALAQAPAYAKNDKQHKHKQLPPGLQKKLERGKPLPPGWQKKLAKGNILDADIYARGKIIVPIDKHGIITLKIEHRVIRLIKATREIIDILH